MQGMIGQFLKGHNSGALGRPTVAGLVTVLLALMISGCSVNPVTGKEQLLLVPESQDYQIGASQYGPAQQSQGGIYYLDPKLSAYVRSVGQKLARVSDRPDLPYEFVVLNNGVPNAWALPSGKIAVDRGLLVQLDNEAELAAVLGHEITHAAARHGAQQLQRGMIVNLGVAGLGMAVADNRNARTIIGGAALGAQLAMARYSREDELEADHYGMLYMARAGYDPGAAVTLQKLFVKLSEQRRQDWLSGLFASHPPSQERVYANEKTAARLGTQGRIGKDAYNKAIAYLKQHQPAYDAQNKAANLLDKGDLDGAQQAISQAIRIEPREAAFYALRGIIAQRRGSTDRALADYDQAVMLNPNLYSYHLGRAILHEKLKQWGPALSDYRAANRQLPTDRAYLGIGDVLRQQGQLQQAVQQYRIAAQSQGPVGDQARRRIAEMTGQ